MRTEANKMHKSIPLRKQETHSASLMTDLGLYQIRIRQFLGGALLHCLLCRDGDNPRGPGRNGGGRYHCRAYRPFHQSLVQGVRPLPLSFGKDWQTRRTSLPACRKLPSRTSGHHHRPGVRQRRPSFNPNRSLDTPGLFSVRKMRLSGILPASVRILFLATPRRSPLRLRLGEKHAA